jgi:hypothetical protein
MIPILDPHARLGRDEEGRLLADLAAGDRFAAERLVEQDRKSTRLNSSHNPASRMPSSA